MRDFPRTTWKTLSRSLLLVVTICGATGYAADWGYDFDGGAAPASWTTVSNTEPAGANSPTFEAVVESGYLRLSDVTPALGDGTFSGFAGTTDDIFTNVTVAASLNVAKDTADDLGVVARVDLAEGKGYYGHVDYENGQACITKIDSLHVGTDLVCTPQDVLGLSDTHRVEFSVLGSVRPTLELLVFDESGDNLLQSINVVDDGSVFGAPFQSGVSGAFIVPLGTTIEDASLSPISGTFDNLDSFAVPEPQSLGLCLAAFVGLLTVRKRR